jgi:hypothetical protein
LVGACLPHPSASACRKAILIVEDEPLIASSIAEDLQSAGASPLTAHPLDDHYACARKRVALELNGADELLARYRWLPLE